LDTVPEAYPVGGTESGAPLSPAFKLRSNGALLVICAGFLLVVLAAIWSRAPEADDGWFASPPYNLLHHGHFGTTTIDPRGYLLRAELTRIDQRTYWVMPANLLAQAAWYTAFGFGLVQMRLLTLFFGLLGLAALYRWVLHLTHDHLAASVAALLMAQDSFIIWRSADGRMDVMCLSLGLLGQASYLAWRERNLPKALLVSNALIALSLLTHPNGIISFLCLAATVLVLDARRLRRAHLLMVAAPYLAAGAAYGAWALRDLGAFHDQLAGNQAADRFAFLTHPLKAIGDELTLYKHVFIAAEYDPGRFAPIKILLLVTWVGGYLGQALAWPRKIRTVAVLSLCGAIPVAVLTFFNGKNAYYFIYIVPFFSACAGVFFAWMWRKGIGLRRLAVAAVAVTLLINAGITAKRTLAARREKTEYLRLSAAASKLLAPGERMIAPADYAFGIGMDRVVDDDTLAFYSHWCPTAMMVRGLSPDEVERLQARTPEVLAYRNSVLSLYYSNVYGSLYRRVSCPPGASPR
jgi:4-amino-4-deoxy-L-arabinose transferase-like glycosyltransferase